MQSTQGTILAVALLLSVSGCSSSAVEDEPPAEPDPQVTQQQLEQSVEAYVEECKAVCDQNARCIDDPKVYHARHCHADCEANLGLKQMDLEDRAAVKRCMDDSAAYSRCVVELSCPQWEQWQQHFGRPTEAEYPCDEPTVAAHRSCFEVRDELDGAHTGRQ